MNDHARPTDVHAVHAALRGWQQRVQAVIEIARDTDDLAARLPVLDALADELVADISRAVEGLDVLAHRPGVTLPEGTDLLREALGKAHDLLHGITLWHRGPSVAALRKARDHFAAAGRAPRT
ncbi:hypothetical protein TBR22_A29050 [Luteitalea sp. TBR-22]|uniref:hypothetical protein n=1 Tax=Luteitalea sp. TBR-22 TaxID=2802971 RepID=UPI001AF78B3E|nr:hypothetical protein [Luteitalea sp. TBR-22]BCS33678.1 hypothetical protein TBR22_A29050 [Luteitalea sp. TBR-22]